MSTATDEATLRSWTERTEELKKDLVLEDTEDWQVGRIRFSGKKVLFTYEQRWSRLLATL